MSALLRIKPWIWGIAAAAVALVLIYGFLWRQAAARITAEIETMASAENGALLSYDQLRAKGFPFFLRLEADNPAFGGDGEQPWLWSAERVVFHALPTNTDHIVAAFEGDHTLVFEQGGVEQVWRITPEAARGSYSLKSARERFALEFHNAAVVQERGGLAQMDAQIARFQISAERDAAETQAGFAIEGLDVTPVLGGAQTAPLMIDRLYAVAGVEAADGAPPLSEPARFIAWAQNGGVVRLKAFELHADDLSLAAAGGLGVDEDGYLAGQVRARASSAASLVEFAARQSNEDGQSIAAIVAAMNLMTVASGATDGSFEAPITIEGGRFFVGPIALARAPRIVEAR